MSDTGSKSALRGNYALVLAITLFLLCIERVLSIGIFCGPVFGIVSVSFGHSALNSIKRDKLPGKGVAIAGLVTGYVALGLSLLIIFAAFILPAIAQGISP